MQSDRLIKAGTFGDVGYINFTAAGEAQHFQFMKV
jgi:hypothetical protein